jgi:hypothetical protein
MVANEALQNMERVKEVATLAGLKGQLDEEQAQFQMRFMLPGDRKQGVFVRDSSAKGRKVVTFFSVCLVVKKGLVSGLSKEIAVDLLKANERLHFARYGIWEFDKEFTVVASCDCLLDTLDPDECHNAAWSVAFAADQFEHRHGQDRF